jgi:hypothetical protein
MNGATILEFCALAVAVSFSSVVVVASFAMICGIVSVLLGKDKDD